MSLFKHFYLTSTQHHLPFLFLIGTMLLCIPVNSVIETLELRPYYSFKPFYNETWRLVSGHLVHASWSHLFVNILNLILLRLVFKEWISHKTFFAFLLFSSLFISTGLWVFTDFTSYVGFSGIFHGLLIYLLLFYWKSSRIIFSIVIGCLVGKILYEQLYGASSALAEFIGIGIAIESHSLGFASGAIFYLLKRILRRET